MANKLYIDFETRSDVDIKHGTYEYAKNATVLLLAWAINDTPVQCVDFSAMQTPDKVILPFELEEAILDPDVMVIAHNAPFEMAIFAHSKNLRRRIVPSRWYCTMAQALAHSLPAKLETLCEVYGMGEDNGKMKIGNALVRKFCIPKGGYKKDVYTFNTKHTHPADWDLFVQYCIRDVEATRILFNKMPKWNLHPFAKTPDGEDAPAKREYQTWLTDRTINDRGIPVDVGLIHKAIELAAQTKDNLADESCEISNGRVPSTTQRDVTLSFIESYGVRLPDLRGSTVTKFLETAEGLPDAVRELLQNRLSASSTSVAKYKAFLKILCEDGRVRNTLQFCGANRTGRWAGRGVQPQNLPRPTLKQKAIETGIKLIKHDAAGMLYSNTEAIELLSSAIRGCIIAPPGEKLVVADLSNIEGRMLAFLAGEDWKLQAFSDFDTCMGVDGAWHGADEIYAATLAQLNGNAAKGVDLVIDKKGEPKRKGHDLYALAYAKSFGVTPEAVMENKRSGDGSWRQIGKVMELALGYEGGVGAFVTFAAGYGIDLEAMAENAIGNIAPDVLEQAEKSWEWASQNGRSFGLSRQVYMVCSAFTKLWRTAHPNVVSFWKDLETAFRSAISVQNTRFYAGRCAVERKGHWVCIILPSGRRVSYPQARIGDDGKISYMGVNQYTRKWSRIMTYSGKLAENVTQAASRDIIAANLPRIEACGYKVITTIHDEDLTLTPDEPRYNADVLAALMASKPTWAEGLPLAAAGFEAYRYRKD